MRSLLLHVLPFAFAIATIHVAYSFSGCAETLQTIDEVNDPSDDQKLIACRKYMREARKDAGGDAHAAWNAYYGCTAEAGLR